MAGGGAGVGGDSVLPRALEHLMALLDCPSRPAATQQHYLDQFIAVARKVQTKQVPWDGEWGYAPHIFRGKILSSEP